MKRQAYAVTVAVLGVMLLTVRSNAQSGSVIEFRAGYASSFAQISSRTVNNNGTTSPIIFTDILGSRDKGVWATLLSMPIATDTCRSITLDLNLHTQGNAVHPWGHEILRAYIEVVNAETGEVLTGNTFPCKLSIPGTMKPGIDTSVTCTFTLSTSSFTSKRIQLRLVASSFLDRAHAMLSKVAGEAIRTRSSQTEVH